MTSFTRQVHQVVRKIPPGQTMTYRAVAVAAGRPRAARAVANLMARNYNPHIPCHRVVRSDGSLGGYNRGGATEKARVLAAERTHRYHSGDGAPVE